MELVPYVGPSPTKGYFVAQCKMVQFVYTITNNLGLGL